MAEEKRLACPLCFANSDVDDYCVEGGCAWWESYEEACSLLVIAKMMILASERGT